MIEMPPKRLTLKGLSEFHYKWGKLWAFTKNRTMSRLIVDVFEARVEANHDFILKMLEDIASQRGVSVDELIAEVMKEESDE